MTGENLSFHRALCQRVDCPKCDGRRETWADHVNRILFSATEETMHYDSTIHPGRRIMPTNWDINVLMEELAHDE